MADINPYLDIIKNASSGDSVRDAIINCMNEINKDTAFTVTDKVISGKISEINNGSPYTAPSGQVWKHVTLNIQDDSGEDYPKSNTKVIDFEVNDNTENGEYTAGENEEYGTIIVNVSHDGEWEGIVDNVAISTLDLDSTSTYHASTQGYTAVKSVTFTNVNAAAARGGRIGSGGVAEYPVYFHKTTGEVIQTQWVTEHGSAQYTGQEPPDSNPDGQFSGWDPTPIGITSETHCKPKYSSGDISHDTITDDWATIKANGCNYDLGSIKTLSVSSTKFGGRVLTSGIRQDKEGEVDYWRATAPDGKMSYSLHMMLVAKGEGGSNGTWLSTEPFNPDSVYNASNNPYNIIDVSGQTHADYRAGILRATAKIENTSIYFCTDDWGSSYLNQWLNSCFFSTLPSSLQQGIVAVPKSYNGILDHNISSENTEIIEKTCVDNKIWIPSAKEMNGFIGDASKTDWAKPVESVGIDYYNAAGWKPIVTGRLYLRSLVNTIWNNYQKGLLYLSRDEESQIYCNSADTGNGCIFGIYGGDRYGYYIGFCL